MLAKNADDTAVAGNDLDSYQDNSATLADVGTAKVKQIECLLCHADIYDVRTQLDPAERTTSASKVIPAGKRMPLSGAPTPNVGGKDLYLKHDVRDAVLASISDVPSNEACRRCHDFAAGGLGLKRGMIYSAEYDVHAANDVLCVDCHKSEDDFGGTNKHKMASGYTYDTWARDMMPDVGPECTDCHQDRPHDKSIINEHFDASDNENVIGDGNPAGKVDCRTCHAPYQYGQMVKDFGTIVYNEATGLYGPYAENFSFDSKFRPEYAWYYNGAMNDHKHPSHLPIGDASRDNGRIYPFRTMRENMIVDAVSGEPLKLKLGALFKTGSIDKAIEAAGDANTYSGEWTTKWSTNYFIIGHRIRPADEALRCYDCHSNSDGILDFEKLGYSKEEAAKLRFLNNK